MPNKYATATKSSRVRSGYTQGKNPNSRIHLGNGSVDYVFPDESEERDIAPSPITEADLAKNVAMMRVLVIDQDDQEHILDKLPDPCTMREMLALVRSGQYKGAFIYKLGDKRINDHGFIPKDALPVVTEKEVKETRIVTKDGYHMTRKPGNPMADVRGYVYDHRLVASQKIGRPLKSNEFAKFVDGDKDNLDPDNIFIVEMKRGSDPGTPRMSHPSLLGESGPSYEQVVSEGRRTCRKIGISMETFLDHHTRGERYCPGCHEWKPVGGFALDKSRTDGRSYYCTPCKVAMNKENAKKRGQDSLGLQE